MIANGNYVADYKHNWHHRLTMEKYYKRALNLPNLLNKKSFFLLGPRATGKTSLIGRQLPGVKTFDLLDSDTFGRLARRPKLLGEELQTDEKLVVIDEIQKLPSLLDEVHRLIEAKRIKFLLTGSSARKLKRSGANLLGGRAWEANLYPLTFAEITDFDLSRYLNRGGIPHIYLSEDFSEELKSYTDLYLREEVMAESLTRKIDMFARFLDVMALQNGEELHYQGLASDSGVPARTLQNYVQLLEDTLIGFQVPAFQLTKKRKAISRSKFFFFDVGVANRLAKRGEILPKSESFGRCFEHFLLLEIRAFLGYARKDEVLQYWRTGNFEVDCVIGSELAIEFKSTDLVTERHLRGLKALREEGIVKNFAVVSTDPVARVVDGIHVYPWQEFLHLLGAGKLV
jgi:predicted AAA+ superfamily ATPase